MKTAVIYTRVSTAEQANKDLSLPFQQQTCKDFAKKESFVTLKVFEEAGKTGTNMKRPQLQEMFQFILEKKVDAIIVYKLDRLSRDMADFFAMLKVLDKNKIEFLSATEANTKGATRTLILGSLSTSSNFYVDLLSERVKGGQKQKVSNGWWPTFAPIGYENYGEKSQRYIRPDKNSAKLVEHTFQLFATGEYSVSSLTETMQKKGMLSIQGNPVSRSAISRMLRNPIYYGDFRWNGEIYEGKHEPIISKKLFNTVQQLLDIRKVKGTRDRTHNFLLRGHVFCTCGARLVGEVKFKKYKNGTKQQFFYFGCKSRKKSKTCSGKYIRMEKLEEMVADEFKKVQFTEEYKKDVVKTGKSILAEVRKTESQEEKIIKNRV